MEDGRPHPGPLPRGEGVTDGEQVSKLRLVSGQLSVVSRDHEEEDQGWKMQHRDNT